MPCSLKAGSSSTRFAIDGVVKNDIPRPFANLPLVYTQKVSLVSSSVIHFGSRVQGFDAWIWFPAFVGQ
jgi:hypothetical protein